MRCHRALLAAVSCEIDLSVAVDVELPDMSGPGTGTLKTPGVSSRTTIVRRALYFTPSLIEPLEGSPEEVARQLGDCLELAL